MPTSQSNVASLHTHRYKASYKLLAYLRARLDAGDLPGLLVQSLDSAGKERTHMTGEYDANRPKAMGAILALSIRMTATQAGFQDSSF